MNTKSQNNGSWGFHINHSDRVRPHSCPQWIVSRFDQEKWASFGIVIWDEPTKTVLCLSPHQALDVLDDLRESNEWESTPLCLYWESYSLPFSEEDRQEWRCSKNRRSMVVENKQVQNRFSLLPDQTRELFVFLEQQEPDISEMAAAHIKKVRRVLGKVYATILSWAPEEKQGGNSSS